MIIYLLFFSTNYSVLELFLEQILAGLILLPALDRLSDPDMINQLLILLFDSQPSHLTSDVVPEQVEMLAQFSHPSPSTSVPVCFTHFLLL